MELNKFIFLFLLSTISLTSYSMVPKYLTKQSPEILRFVSSNGRFYYFQQKKNSLSFSKEYQSEEILSFDNNYFFKLTSSLNQKRILIEAMENPHHNFDLFKSHKIYWLDMGGKKPRFELEGVNAGLHLEDEWISAYDPKLKEIIIKQIANPKTYRVALSQNLNSFFIPEIILINPDVVMYTDMDPKGRSQIISFHMPLKKKKVLFTSESAHKIEMCQNQQSIFWGIFPHEGVNGMSQILELSSSSVNFTKYTEIYKSELPDIGHLTCLEKTLYFVKTNHFKNFQKESEVASIDLKSKKVTMLTNFGRSMHVFRMDKTVLTPWQGDYYVISGTSNISEDKLPTKEKK